MPAKPLKTTPFRPVFPASVCLSETTPFCPPKPRLDLSHSRFDLNKIEIPRLNLGSTYLTTGSI
ncbi:Uncharacterized protein TCM_037737 [Theobroma cacao]|uniref:Uncharacterized protein n=1 Tax=Theobroma cacao TaxID=3641 RepID=A0A061GN52_THECC|nr:Uncharacterized protein TCM_037737 [Theobroma cacao]